MSNLKDFRTPPPIAILRADDTSTWIKVVKEKTEEQIDIFTYHHHQNEGQSYQSFVHFHNLQNQVLAECEHCETSDQTDQFYVSTCFQ